MDAPRRRAVDYFGGKAKYNCAEAILLAFLEVREVSQETINRAATWGRGRAEGGLCGALFAGKSLLGDSPLADILAQRFSEAAGSGTCRRIRKLKTLSCRQCVETVELILRTLISENENEQAPPSAASG